MSHAIGIDLGTTNSVVCLYQRGQIETIPIDNFSTLPSAISVLPNGKILVGTQAKNRAIISPDQSVTSAKRFIGDSKTKWHIQGHTYNPIDVSQRIICKLKDAASEYLKTNVKDAVITVPAYFNNNQKRDTKIAAEEAGLNVLQLLPEPTAAAISYGLDRKKNQTILVYDLGGGTFDVSILKVTDNQFTVIAVDGDFNLGGDDIDLLLAKFLFERLKSNKSTTMNPDDECLIMQQLKEVAEQAKKELSVSDTTIARIPNLKGGHLEEKISIHDYNEMICPLVDKTIHKIKSVLHDAGLDKRDIDRVLLVGGSTRNRLIKERIAETVKEPFVSDRVDEVVAQGAAIVAGYLFSPQPDMLPMEFNNVTPFNLGVRTTEKGESDKMEVLIHKNSPVPVESEKDFTTIHDNQNSVDIRVFQGDQSHCSDNTFIGGFELTGIPPAKAKEPKIVVNFKMDQSDLLIVTASCEHLKESKNLDINLVSHEDESTSQAKETDIHFLIDTSGSMRNELESVKKSCIDFADHIISAGIDCRLGLIDFDKGFRNYKWEIFGPCAPSTLKTSISKLSIGRLGGCGCYIGEKDTIPVIQAFADSFTDQKRFKIGILISDEVGNNADAIPKIIHILQNNDICMHVVGLSNSCHVRIAEKTGGKFWDIVASRGKVSFDELLNDIAKEITQITIK